MANRRPAGASVQPAGGRSPAWCALPGAAGVVMASWRQIAWLRGWPRGVQPDMHAAENGPNAGPSADDATSARFGAVHVRHGLKPTAMAWRGGRLWARRATIVAPGVLGVAIRREALRARSSSSIPEYSLFGAQARARMLDGAISTPAKGGSRRIPFGSTALHIISRRNGLTWNVISNSSVYDPLDPL
jgi:hypothetical protein